MRNSKIRKRIAAGKVSFRVRDLRNLGPRSEALLEQAGVRSVAQLRRIGALEAFWKVKRARLTNTLNMLWALVGALEPWPEGRNWRDVASSNERLGLMLALESREQARDQVLEAAGLTPPKRSARPKAKRRSLGGQRKTAAQGLIDPLGMLLPEKSSGRRGSQTPR